MPDVSTSIPQSKNSIGNLWRHAETGSRVFAIQYREIDREFFLQMLQILMDDRAAGLADGVADKKNFHGEKRKPRNRRVAHLFEPVYTGGRPIRALGDLGTPKGKARTPRGKSDSLTNKHWFKFC